MTPTWLVPSPSGTRRCAGARASSPRRRFAAGSRWVARLGPPPPSPERHERWLEAVATVAAYRERWGVGDSDRPLGDESAAASVEAVRHRERALAAANAAYGLGNHRRAACASARAQPSADPVVEVGMAVEL